MPFWGWDLETMAAFLKAPSKPKLKYIVTDSKEEFMAAMQRIADRSIKATKDNLRYLEQLDKIRQIKEGAAIEDVYPWVKGYHYQ